MQVYYPCMRLIPNQRIRNTISTSVLSVVVTMLCACTAPPYKNIVEHTFGDNTTLSGVTFSTGPWFAPGSQAGFHLLDGTLRLVDLEDETSPLQLLSSDCEPLQESIQSLRDSIADSVVYIAGVEEPKEPEVLVMDGWTHELRIDDSGTFTELNLSGGDTSSYVVPWIGAAFEVMESAKACDKASIADRELSSK